MLVTDDELFPEIESLTFHLATNASPAPLANPDAEDLFQDVRRAFGRLTQRVKKLLKQALRKGSMSEKILAARRVLKAWKPQLAQALGDVTIAALVAGMGRVVQDIPESSESLPHRADLSGSPPSVPPRPPAIGQADLPGERPWIRLPRIENAVDDLRARQLLPRSEYDQLTAQARERAFTVAGVETEEVLGKIQAALVESTEQGLTLNKFLAKVEQDVAPGTFLSRAHGENCFRSNIMTGYAVGMDRILDHPLVGDLFPFVAIWATHDDRVRPNHLALEKLGIQGTNIYYRADPVYRLFRGPWDFQCRCISQPMTVEQAAARGIVEAIRWLETGKPPDHPTYVAMPSFRPPDGWKRDFLLSTRKAG